MTKDDLEQMHRAVDLVLADTSEPLRIEQINSMLEDRPRDEVGEFAVYHLQCKSLNLAPWQLPPCASTGAGNNAGSKLRRQMIEAGISPWHPFPLKALEEVQE